MCVLYLYYTRLNVVYITCINKYSIFIPSRKFELSYLLPFLPFLLLVF